ncbi:uncharacterized protein EV154DRAFT_494685 [Mucor mucedo]|uniref:uncharacterized protein n=1 Tax=Mucor mucedo TaxID=29922 RepID=UPI00221EB1CC|nr:uncharacterized protein EV154DRAFT_494685 [Mucor mucedo]KAI7895712.1 hypothetical protein EV154DRAFT_494685 [Mucor mucedo]
MLSSGFNMSNVVKRPEFKEKFVETSKDLFKGSTLYTTSDEASIFWDNYLILPVNALCITQLIQSQSEESLLDLQHNLSGLFLACLEKLETTSTCMSDTTRQKNALAVLTVLIRNLFSKKRLTHFNIISILTGLDKADVLFSKLVKAMETTLEQDELRHLVLQLALVMSAGSDNVNQNGLNGYFMTNDLSKTLFKILAEQETDQNDTRDIVMLLGMLSNYNKYESRNPYLIHLTNCKQTQALENIISMYTTTFISLRSRYIQINDDEETLSKTLVTYMSRWFSSSAPPAPSDAENSQSLSSLPSAQTALLLPLYDFINTNSYFVNTLVNTCSRIDAESKDQPDDKTTLLTALLSFASYLFQNNRTDRTNTYSRLLLTILLRLMEENAIMNYIAREGSSASVRLCRQRSPPLPLLKSQRSLFCIVLDNMLLFIKHNVRKKLDLFSYKLAYSVIHRILCFISKHKIRLEYHWVELWPTLTSVLHFNALRLEDLQQKEEFGLYLGSFMSVFNMCVTYGETFLSDTKSYDSLYYEIIRATTDFIQLSEYVNRSVMVKSRGDRSPSITFNEFYNIQLICNHFKPALDEWQAAKNIKFPTPEQVMAIINVNYATLELKAMDKLDSYVSFNEIPAEMGFFRQVLRVVVIDYLECYNIEHISLKK